jgi:asparagine synthase (glutamine-hydrolysing)
MCGIVGVVFAADKIEIKRGLLSLHNRGPDASGVFTADDVVLGHTRLAILDLSDAAIQPMKSADGRAVVVFNGEIYNHHALRADLVARGRRFRTRSDTEVIVEGYQQYGVEFFERLDGMFAIGLFDLEKRRLLLVRDRAGKKPLFYSRRGDTVAFASTIRALFSVGCPTDIDVASVPMLLGLGYVPPPSTLYRDVCQLPPATIMEISRGTQPKSRCYWKAPFGSEVLNVSADEATANLRELVEGAVNRRLEADVPLGAFLSGGIDSTIVVGLMARAMSRPVKTFSIGFAGDARFDETRYAKIAARAFATEHTEFRLEPSAFDLLDQLVEAHDGPFGDSSAIPTSVVSMLTRKHVTVALSGDGGDELFAGYTRFLAAEAAERVPRPLRSLAGRVARILPERPRTVARARKLMRAASVPLIQRMFRWQSYFSDDLEQILNERIRNLVDARNPIRWSEGISERTSRQTPLTRALQYNFDSYLPFDLLVKTDRASMLHSLEVRSPFLDTALIEYAARLPDAFRRQRTRTKWLLLRAFRDVLPTEIQRRGKMGFGMPLGTWFRTTLRDFVRQTLGGRPRIGDYVNTVYVERLLDLHDRGVRDLQHPIWLLLTMERWLQLLPSWRS